MYWIRKVTISADYFTLADAQSIPTGELTPVKGTPMDFNEAKAIGQDIEADYQPLIDGKGYDHNWVIRGEGFRKAASIALLIRRGIPYGCISRSSRVCSCIQQTMLIMRKAKAELNTVSAMLPALKHSFSRMPFIIRSLRSRLSRRMNYLHPKRYISFLFNKNLQKASEYMPYE